MAVARLAGSRLHTNLQILVLCLFSSLGSFVICKVSVVGWRGKKGKQSLGAGVREALHPGECGTARLALSGRSSWSAASQEPGAPASRTSAAGSPCLSLWDPACPVSKQTQSHGSHESRAENLEEGARRVSHSQWLTNLAPSLRADGLAAAGGRAHFWLRMAHPGLVPCLVLPGMRVSRYTPFLSAVVLDQGSVAPPPPPPPGDTGPCLGTFFVCHNWEGGRWQLAGGGPRPQHLTVHRVPPENVSAVGVGLGQC